MKWIYVFSIIIVVSGCCKLPMVDCGPKIVQLSVSPVSVGLPDVNIKFSAWQYYSRTTGKPLLVDFYCEVHRSDSALIEEALFFISSDSALVKPSQMDLFSSGLDEGIETKIYSAQISNCCENYPLKVWADSIPVIRNADTNYVRINEIIQR